MTDWHTAMSGWTEEGLAEQLAINSAKAKHGRVITLNDVANRLVALADSAGSYSDIYDCILDDTEIEAEVEAAIELGSSLAGVAPATTIRQSASDAIDLAARVLTIIARRTETAETARPATAKELVEEAVAKAARLD